MKKLLLALFACAVLLCSCSYSYTGELPEGITPETNQSEVIEKFGESQYSCEETGDFTIYNTLVYDYETQYDKCLLEFFFDKETNELVYVSYAYYGDQKKMISLLKSISDDMKAKYGNDYSKSPYDLDENADLYKEDHDYDFVYVSFSWNDNSSCDVLNVGYTHQFNQDRLFIKELPTCETSVSINIFLNKSIK